MVNNFLAALRFLTVLPVPGKVRLNAQTMRQSVAWYPAVGICIGVIMVLVAWGVELALPPIASSAIIVVVLAAVSGGFHLDGLADTADGLFSVSSRSDTLRIMKDSRVGVMGVLAIVAALLLKFAALAGMASSLRWQAVLFMSIAGKCSLVYMLYALPYAKGRQPGLGGVFFENNSFPALVIAFLIFAGSAIAVGGIIPGMILTATAVACASLFTIYIRWKLGGGTGDTAGALAEITETVTVLLTAGLIA